MTPTDPIPEADVADPAEAEPLGLDPADIQVGMFVGYTVTSVGNDAGAWIVDPETGLVTGPVPAAS